MKTPSYLRALSSLPFVAFRRSRVFAIFAAIVTTQAQAILDTNSNALSDLWEKQHNNGNLLPNTFLATSDNDKDGWTNAKEAIAGTNPFEANPPDGIVALTITPSLIEGSYTLTWNTLVGKNYQLKVSTDLINWSNLGDPITTSQNTHTIGVNTNQPGTTIPPTVFWQINVTDLDIDNDGLTNAEEHSLGTNPFLDDTDGDTLKDKAEILAGTNPLDVDTDEDGLNDNLDATPLSNDATADPDGANLAAHLNNYNTETNGVKLIARYDFETFIPTETDFAFPSSVPNIPAATTQDYLTDTYLNPGGIPSFCARWNAFNTYGQRIDLPHEILDDRAHFTWSYWIKFPKNAFVSSQQNTGTRSLLSIGIDRNAPDIPGQSSPLPALHWYCDIATGMIHLETYQTQIGTAVALGTGWNIPAAWNDGDWHHMVISKQNDTYTIHFDATSLGDRTSVDIPLPLTIDSYIHIGCRDMTDPYAEPDDNKFPNKARLDRLRCYTKLNATDISALYHHDIDRDGLFDRTESRHRLWIDHNTDAWRDANESDYILRPFHHDAVGTDHDKDGIPSHNEQNGTPASDSGNIDTDLDLLLDGWEKTYGFSYHDPNAPSDRNNDPDDDGADNLNEYRNRTNPTVADTDGDGVNDGPENAQGSDGTDASDQGLPPDPDQTYSLTIGVGDESHSHSERYELVVYEYDWATRTETEVHRLAGQNYGQYQEETIIGLNPIVTYTFQIRWTGTKLDYDEGPDFDYTFKIENPDPTKMVGIIQTLDTETGQINDEVITGEHEDVTTFLITTEPKRVISETILHDFAVDTDMDGKIESLYRRLGNSNQFVPDQSQQDRDLLANDPQRAAIIDVNNNNTDSKTASPSKTSVDNTDNKLDSQADKTEITASPTGHSFGNIRFWCWPSAELGIPWLGNKPATYKIKLSYADPAQANYVRVFGPDNVPNDNSMPEMYLGPGKTEHFIDPVAFFTQIPFKNPQLATSYRYLVAEGITYGTATIKMEIIRVTDNAVMGTPQQVRLSVNVDRIEQRPAKVAENKDALHLRGVAPHHFGVRKPGQSTAGIRAIKGKLTIRLPSSNAGNNARLTPMDGRELKKQISDLDQTDSGGSFWIGLTQNNASGALEQWVQTGVRWVQPPNKLYASPPALYLELGDTFKSLGAKALSQASTNHTDKTWLGGGVTGAANTILSGWHNSSKELDFILFKPIGPKDQAGNDEHIENWNVIFKDQNGNYLRLDRSNPNPPPKVTATNAEQVELANRYKSQQFKHIDCLFETNNSITLTVGTSNSQGSFSNLQHAGVYIAEAAAMPTSGTDAQIFSWAESNFSWSDTSFNGGASEVKTGGWNINDSGVITGATDGTHDHPFWRKTVTPTSIHIWDLRNYGYNTAQ